MLHTGVNQVTLHIFCPHTGGGTGRGIPKARKGVNAIAPEDEEKLMESFVQPLITFNAPQVWGE